MKASRGQIVVEVLGLALALAAALLLPINGDQPAATVLLEALVHFLHMQAFVLSIV